MNPRRTCAVLFRSTDATGRRVKVLATGIEMAGHTRSLDPWASQLHLKGTSGTLLLVDDVTNEVICRREVAPDLPWRDGRKALKAPLAN